MSDKITADLDARNLKVIMFMCENADGDIVCISYDNNGLVKHIERPVESISVNEHVDGRVYRPLFEISRKGN
jgi:hypothetical protein